MALSLDKLVSNLYDISKIHGDKLKGDMELIKILVSGGMHTKVATRNVVSTFLLQAHPPL